MQLGRCLGPLGGPRRPCPALARQLGSSLGAAWPQRRQPIANSAAPQHAATAAAGVAGGAPHAAPAAPLAGGPPPPQPQLPGLEEVLSRARAAVGEGLAGIKGGEVIVHGTGRHLGSPVAWTLRFRRDGAFYEEVRSKHLTFKWGHDGSADGACWEVDPAGVAKHLEYDDHESMLLALLVRSGVWLDAEAMAGRLEFRALHIGGGTTPQAPLREGAYADAGGGGSGGGGGVDPDAPAGGGSGAAGSSSGAAAAVSSSSSSPGGSAVAPAPPAIPPAPKGPSRRPSKRPRRISVSPRPTEAAGNGSSGGGGVKGPVYVDIALRGARMLARVELCPDTWHPVGFAQAVVGWDEPGAPQPPSLWAFEDWRQWAAPAAGLAAPAAAARAGAAHGGEQQRGPPPVVHFPLRVFHNATVGGVHEYHTTAVQLQRALISSVAYTIPLCTRLPVDASFDASQPAGTWAWKAPSGHIVVPVSLPGLDPGYMLLDTGASGFVLQAGLAAKAGMARFGRLNIAGLTGKVHTCFCRAPYIRLGPLTVRDPVLMEMNVGGLVRGLEPGIIGIAGYDVFRRAVFEFPTVEETATALAALGTAAVLATALAAVPPSRAAEAAAIAAKLLPPGVGGSGGESSDSEMTAFDAGTLGPLQRQLTGTAHAASVAAGSSSGGALAVPTSSGSSTSGSVAWGGDGSGSSSSTASSGGRGARGARGPAAPPVPVPGPHPPKPGPDLKPLWLLIHNPESPPAFSEHYIWHPMRMIGNLPHAEITFRAPSGAEHRALFMLDSGAGGADLLFHGRASRELGLVTADEAAGRGDRSRVRSVRGVGGEAQAAMRVVLGELEWADWGGVRFEKLRALFSLRGGLDISLYSAGIIGADLINRRRVVVDYANARIGILAPEARGGGGSGSGGGGGGARPAPSAAA